MMLMSNNITQVYQKCYTALLHVCNLVCDKKSLISDFMYQVFILCVLERLSALLPEEAQQQIHTVLPKRDEFEIAYRLDCRNLCAEFQEDIAFHFSLGPMNLFRRLMGTNRFGIARKPHQFDAVSIE